MLKGVVDRGTGRAARLDRPIAGKTGTTDEEHDAWFVGFSPNLVAGVFVGFDQPSSLGERETGGSVAAPIFADFMREALGARPAVPFSVPPGLSLIRVHAKTGLPSRSGGAGTIWEAFKTANQPDILSDAPDVAETGPRRRARRRRPRRRRPRAPRDACQRSRRGVRRFGNGRPLLVF